MAGKFVIMGVAGCGKSAVGAALSGATGLHYMDGDDLHPAANIAKMSSGIPLTDEDRWPWLQSIGALFAKTDAPLAIGCSALKRTYRDFIIAHAGDPADSPVVFIYLEGSRDLIGSRMADREGHFMPTALLDSQFQALEPPAVDEQHIVVDISQSIDAIVADVVARLALDKP
ncbi:MAG: gluconokinase [Pseudomonadota bacterium]